MDYIRLNNGTKITIEDGASLDRIIHIADTDADAVAVCRAVTAGNLAHVEFCTEDGDAYGIYDNLTLIAAPTREDAEDGKVIVRIALREKTELELRVDALEESQATQDGAIEDLGQVLSDIVEG